MCHPSQQLTSLTISERVLFFGRSLFEPVFHMLLLLFFTLYDFVQHTVVDHDHSSIGLVLWEPFTGLALTLIGVSVTGTLHRNPQTQIIVSPLSIKSLLNLVPVDQSILQGFSASKDNPNPNPNPNTTEAPRLYGSEG